MTLILLNKPFGVICQFSREGKHPTLADFVRVPDVYPAGRLDTDSEGLVLLTDDGILQARISAPKSKTAKHYWVQVEGTPDQAALEALNGGIDLGDFVTRPAQVRVIDEPPGLWPRNPPIRYRAAIPTTWLEVVISEGKNRQVRRMTAGVGHPTLRLIRHRIGDYALEDTAPGQWRELQAPASSVRRTAGERPRPAPNAAARANARSWTKARAAGDAKKVARAQSRGAGEPREEERDFRPAPKRAAAPGAPKTGTPRSGVTRAGSARSAGTGAGRTRAAGAGAARSGAETRTGAGSGRAGGSRTGSGGAGAARAGASQTGVPRTAAPRGGPKSGPRSGTPASPRPAKSPAQKRSPLRRSTTAGKVNSRPARRKP